MIMGFLILALVWVFFGMTYASLAKKVRTTCEFEVKVVRNGQNFLT